MCCVLLHSGLYGVAIINNSDSQKQVELIAYIPNNNPASGVTPTTVIKKDLQPNERIEAPLSLLEVGINLKWGSEKIVTAESTSSHSLKLYQFNIFKKFSPQDALPTPYVRGVPKTIGKDHVFTIIGSGYETDVILVYTPDATTQKSV
jgi:hypothetical protein